MRLETQIVKTPDGIELFVRDYRPSECDPLRTLYWVHGLGEHGGRQGHVAEALTQNGWRMVIADLRGHGGSTGVRTYVKSFDDYVTDTELVWKQLALDADSTVLLGHSMGGLIAVRAVQMGRVVPKALVLSSPLLGLKLRINPLTVMLGRLLIRFLPTARFSNGIDPANMTHDAEFAALRKNDQLMEKTVTAGWFFAMQAALSAAQQQTDQVTIPVLALQGSLDQTTDPRALEMWLSRIQATVKKLIVLDGHFHELFFEPDWRATTGQLIEWLEERIQVVDSRERS